MSARDVKVLISDDHALVREGLKRILLESGTVSHVGEAAHAQEALDAVRREAWDVVVLDVNFGGRSGMEVLREIRAERPPLPVLVLSIYPDEQFAAPVIRAGASGYLNKRLAARCLVEAIRQLLAGGHYGGPGTAKPPVGG
jgi:DNA-binding NarL/FixJ family response regulator